MINVAATRARRARVAATCRARREEKRRAYWTCAIIAMLVEVV
jgi:hypothetical protein